MTTSHKMAVVAAGGVEGAPPQQNPTQKPPCRFQNHTKKDERRCFLQTISSDIILTPYESRDSLYCSQAKHTTHCLTVMKDTLYALRSETVISKF